MYLAFPLSSVKPICVGGIADVSELSESVTLSLSLFSSFLLLSSVFPVSDDAPPLFKSEYGASELSD